MLRRIHHIIAQLVLRLMNPGRIQEDNLSPLRGQHRPDPVACGLGLCGSDGYLLPDQLIHQSGFSHVWPAYQGDKACFILIIIHDFPAFAFFTTST